MTLIPKTDLQIPDPFFNCPLCDYSTFRLGSLTNHVEKKHPEHFFGIHRY